MAKARSRDVSLRSARAAKSGEKPTPAVSGPAPLSGAARAAASLEIQRVRFLDLRVSTGYTAFEELPLQITSKIGFTRPRVETKGDQARVVSTFVFRIVPAQEPSAAPPFELRAKTELVYQIKGDPQLLKPEDLEKFARINAPFNAWAYWREIVRSALSRLDLPPFLLPLFRVADAARLTLDDTAFSDAGR
jgi:hypothetical protein